MASRYCVLTTWCKRPNNHDGPCRREASKKDLEKLLESGPLTEAEKARWRRLGGRE